MPGSSKPPRVSDDASLDKMFEAETVQGDGKTSLPALGIENETADGERAHFLLNLPPRITGQLYAAKAARRLQDLGVNSTSRARRAEWKGRELTAQELARLAHL